MAKCKDILALRLLHAGARLCSLDSDIDDDMIYIQQQFKNNDKINFFFFCTVPTTNHISPQFKYNIYS